MSVFKKRTMLRDNKEKKIIFIIGSMRRGGAERVISILANHYVDKGWSVKIITLLDSSNDYILRDSIKVISISDENKSRFQQLFKWIVTLRNLFREENPTVIVSFIARINILTILANIGLRNKIVISERNDPKRDGRSLLVEIATYIFYPFVEYIVFQTNWAKRCFPKYIQKKGIIIVNPIDIKIKSTIKKEKKIVAIGRLVEQKNHKLLIESFYKVLKKYPDYKLYIYGEGKLRSDLQSQIDKLNISDKVFMPGNVLDIHDKIIDSKLFVLSSDYEGLSNALLEAMMMGFPCISTNCAGSNEVIEDGMNGILVPVNDNNELYKAILKIIENPEIAFRLGKNAELSTIKFKREEVIYEWEKVIEKNL